MDAYMSIEAAKNLITRIIITTKHQYLRLMAIYYEINMEQNTRCCHATRTVSLLKWGLPRPPTTE